MVSIMNNPDDIDFIIRALGFSSALLSNRLDDIKSLLNDLSRNIISSSDMSEQLKIMTKRELILKQQKDYSPDNLVCNLFEGRTLETMTNSKDRTCFSGLYDNLDDAKKALIEEFNSCNGKCIQEYKSIQHIRSKSR